MRLVSVLLLPALLLGPACGGGAPTAGPQASASGSPGLGVEDVERALAATRAAKTGSYTSMLTTKLGSETFLINQEGSFDIGAGVATVDQSMSGSPEALRALGIGSASDLSSRSVLTPTAAYLQMTAWPPPMKGRWLRYTEADFASLGVEAAPLGEVLPSLVAMLEHAQPAPGRAASGRTAYVLVPAADALSAFPSSSTRKLVAQGLDLAKLDGEQLVEVYIDDAGRIGEVRLSADELFDRAYALAGLPAAAAAQTTAVLAEITLSGYGTPVRIAVPSGPAVATPDELESLSG